MDGSAPWRQTSFDWRAAGNFTFGATGAGLAFFAALLAFEAGGRVVAGFLLAPLLVAAGIALVWSEIGRPKQFLHVFFHPQTPWKTREAIIAPVLVVATLVALVFPISILLLLVVFASGGFLYAQGRVLSDAEGPSAWRYRGIVPVIIATGAAEGAALLAVVATLTLSDGALPAVRVAFLLGVLRWPIWTFYRNGLAVGAPAQAADTLRSFGERSVAVVLWVPTVLLGLGMVLSGFASVVSVIGGVAAVAAGWWLKYLVINESASGHAYAVPAPSEPAAPAKPPTGEGTSA